jgi:hypothetical protein
MVLLEPVRGERGLLLGDSKRSGVAMRGGVEGLREWDDNERAGGRWLDDF